MSQTKDITLHAEPSLYGSSLDPFLQNEDKMSVAELIPQIIVERKSFLNISEELVVREIEQNRLLALEIESLGGIGTLPQNREEYPETPATDVGELGQLVNEDEESAVERFNKQKHELLTHIGSALNETSLLLDFVSLLMSAEKPNIAKLTISPHLAKTAPLGSLSSDKLSKNDENAPKLENDKKTTTKIGLGWKYKSLKNVRDVFNDAASQLRAQVSVEKNYWSKVQQVLAHDEVLFKLRDPANNHRAIGVKYGYGDSGLTYHDKGVAVLRKNDATGDVTFCPISSASGSAASSSHAASYARQKYTRVRILSKIDDDYMLTGQLVMDKAEMENDTFKDAPLVKEIEKARFFLFEDDLFYHLIREAKNLMSYNVTIIADKIIVDTMDQIVEIESVYYQGDDDEESAHLYQNTNAESSKYNRQAQDMLRFLKLMLCCYYLYRLKLKQKMPTSFTKWKQANSHPLLLRPLIGHIRHQSNVRKMRALLLNLSGDLDPTLVQCEVLDVMYANLKTEKAENPFQKAIQRPVSTFELVIEKKATQQHLKAQVEVTTTEIFVDLILQLTVSKFKNKHDLELNLDGTNVLLFEFTDLADFGESLDWTVTNFMDDLET